MILAYKSFQPTTFSPQLMPKKVCPLVMVDFRQLYFYTVFHRSCIAWNKKFLQAHIAILKSGLPVLKSGLPDFQSYISWFYPIFILLVLVEGWYTPRSSRPCTLPKGRK